MLALLFLTTIFLGENDLFAVTAFEEVGVEVCRMPNGNFPKLQNCSTFVRCEDGIPSIEYCPEGLFFNPFISACDFSKTGNCSNAEDFDTTPTLVGTQEIECTSLGPMIIADASGCSSIYYLCENDTAYQVQCPTGLLMNTVKMICDYPNNTGCDIADSEEDNSMLPAGPLSSIDAPAPLPIEASGDGEASPAPLIEASGDGGALPRTLIEASGDGGALPRTLIEASGDGGALPRTLIEASGDGGALPRTLIEASGDGGALPRTLIEASGDGGALPRALIEASGDGGALPRTLIEASGDYDDSTPPPTEGSDDYDDSTPPPTEFSGDYDDSTPPPTEVPGDYDDPTPPPTEGPGDYDDPTPPPTEGPGDYDDPTPPPTEGPGDYDDPTPPPTESPGDYDDPTLRPTEGPGDYDDPTPLPTEGPGDYDDPTPPPAEGSDDYDGSPTDWNFPPPSLAKHGTTSDTGTRRTFSNYYSTFNINTTTETLDIITTDRWNNTDIPQPNDVIAKCDDWSNLPNSDNCSTYFQCYEGVPVLSNCPGNFHFNPHEKMCQEPCTAKCDVNADCQAVPEPPRQVPPRLCERNDFIARPECNEYTDCSESLSIPKTCPDGLHFNPTKRVCDWPSIAGCGSILYPLHKPDESFDCPCKSCLVPSTENCSDYYLCLGETAYHLTCSKNLLFDRSLNTCNYAHVVKCDLITTTIADSIESENSSLYTTFPTIESTMAIMRPFTIAEPTVSTMRPFETAEQRRFTCPSREGLFKNTTDCGKFIQCSNWIPYEMHCLPPSHFSEITNRCENPCDAKCDTSLACEPSTARPMDPECSCRNCKLPSSKSCTDYIWCTNGKARVMKCGNGQTFDKERGVCDWADKLRCEHSEMCPNSNGLFPDKDDCHRFINCFNGIPYMQKCDYILEFDPDSKRCEWPRGRCNNSPIDKEFDFDTEEKREGFKCPKSYGYFSHESHCSKFYQCTLGTPLLKECSEGLLYNPFYQTCDWKKHVNCDNNRNYQPQKCTMFYQSVTCHRDRKPLSHLHCNMYYDCTTGRACVKQCPIGLKFNEKTGICDLPQLVECYNPEKLENDSLRRFSKKCSETGEGHLANPFDVACYYRCRQRRVIPGCCTRGRVYNESVNKCKPGKASNRKQSRKRK